MTEFPVGKILFSMVPNLVPRNAPLFCGRSGFLVFPLFRAIDCDEIDLAAQVEQITATNRLFCHWPVSTERQPGSLRVWRSQASAPTAGFAPVSASRQPIFATPLAWPTPYYPSVYSFAPLWGSYFRHSVRPCLLRGGWKAGMALNKIG